MLQTMFNLKFKVEPYSLNKMLHLTCSFCKSSLRALMSSAYSFSRFVTSSTLCSFLSRRDNSASLFSIYKKKNLCHHIPFGNKKWAQYFISVTKSNLDLLCYYTFYTLSVLIYLTCTQLHCHCKQCFANAIVFIAIEKSLK